MADSVDRVFSHALHTVRKLRTGASNPPTRTRMQLYGLYKQAMEGDVAGILPRPAASTAPSPSPASSTTFYPDGSGGGRGGERGEGGGGGGGGGSARDKWDAWKACEGMSKTAAKRGYIAALIAALRAHAAGENEEARELVEELEFVWEQVRSNTEGASVGGSPRMESTPRHTGGAAEEADRDGERERVEDTEAEGEEFVDAVDGHREHDAEQEGTTTTTTTPNTRQPADALKAYPPPPPPSSSSVAQRWRRQVETSLIKMTAEIAALREQLESRRLFSHRRRMTLLEWLYRVAWFAAKHVAVDLVLLGIVLVWMRRRRNTKLEDAVKVLLGRAIAQVQKAQAVGGKTVANLPVPKLGGKRA